MNFFLSPSLSSETYGLGISVYNNFKAFNENGHNAKVITSDEKFKNKVNQSNHSNIIFVKSFYPYPFSFSRKISKILIKEKASLIDLHGLWTPYSIICLNLFKKYKVPYLITTHGMLDKYGLQRKLIKKNIAMFLYQRSCLLNAKAFRVTSRIELNNLRSYGITQPIAIIPHGTKIKTSLKEIEHKTRNDSKNILFLGRLDPIKNLESLLIAWSLIEKDNKSWNLLIAGVGNIKYTEKLKNLSGDLNLKNIKWLGYLNNEEKERVIKSSSLLILPSFSENYGLVVIESLILGTPVIVSDKTPWLDLKNFNCGYICSTDYESIKINIDKFISLNFSERINMSKSSFKYASLNYNWELISSKLSSFYDWVRDNKKEKPNFIDTL